MKRWKVQTLLTKLNKKTKPWRKLLEGFEKVLHTEDKSKVFRKESHERILFKNS